MRRRHRMPFGAELLKDGRVRFRLWAPRVKRVDLCLEHDNGESLLPMTADTKGWFSLCTEAAGPGDLYRYRLDGGLRVADPASRFQPYDVHGPSQVLDPTRWQWQDTNWQGLSWEQAVFYELHVGTYSSEGSFAAVKQRLDHIVELGITAIELMPLADFSGARNWGYDGVLQFAPDSVYGKPDELKDLIDTAHQKGLMVFLDVVYNHFGPEGNYLHAYAPEFFAAHRQTPWGPAINFDGTASNVVRQFFIHNALYWLEEYHFDGLRLDSAHAMVDTGSPHILEELATRVRQGPGRQRQIHLVLENDHNDPRYLSRQADGRASHYVAQWNDDIHHAMHLLLTGEADGYYGDYANATISYVGRCLAEGFGYQGEVSAYRKGVKRGAPSGSLPPTAFVSFLQNHDQVGNRAFGERIHRVTDERRVRAALAVMLLAPSPPLLFMGEEFAACAPFLYFCDFDADLGRAVARGRSREFARFERFADPVVRGAIPDPNAPATFEQSKLDWDDLTRAPHCEWLAFYRQLLTLRHKHIVPLLTHISGGQSRFHRFDECGLRVKWPIDDDRELVLWANLGEVTIPIAADLIPVELPLYGYPADIALTTKTSHMPAWSVVWYVQRVSHKPPQRWS